MSLLGGLLNPRLASSWSGQTGLRPSCECCAGKDRRSVARQLKIQQIQKNPEPFMARPPRRFGTALFQMIALPSAQRHTTPTQAPDAAAACHGRFQPQHQHTELALMHELPTLLPAVQLGNQQT